MMETAPSTLSRRLKWHREALALTQEAVAAELGLNDRQSISDIENGKRAVSPKELAALAGLFQVKVEDLLDPFRLVGEGGFNFRVEEVSEELLERFAVQAGTWIATYRELGRQAGIEPGFFGHKLELTELSTWAEAAASAEKLRIRWNLGEVPAETLANAIERELDVLVLYVDAPRGLSGAASKLPGLQTILVNRAEVPSRRMFDLAHELFHVLTWDALPPARVEGWSPSDRKGNRVEKLANAFAAALLMPESTVRARFPQGRGYVFNDWLASSAHALRVSPIALHWRCHNLGLTGRPHGTTVVGNSVEPNGAPPPLFSARFVERVHSAVESGRLSLRKAAGLLELSLAEFSELCRTYGRPLSFDA
jgi:Zn-dependent peptidase ImmA (M78 family)/DNA-binding XRE family transcriptional regulator